MTKPELIQDGTLATSYFGPCSKKYAIASYTRITATHHLKGHTGPVSSFILQQFGEDVERDQLSVAQLEEGFAEWRKKNTSYAPTYGQLFTIIQKIPVNRQTGRKYQQTLKAVLKNDPLPAISRPWEKAGYQSEFVPDHVRLSESRELLSRMEREKSQGFYFKKNGDQRPWDLICEKMRIGVAGRVEMLEEKASRRAA